MKRSVAEGKSRGVVLHAEGRRHNKRMKPGRAALRCIYPAERRVCAFRTALARPNWARTASRAVLLTTSWASTEAGSAPARG